MKKQKDSNGREDVEEENKKNRRKSETDTRNQKFRVDAAMRSENPRFEILVCRSRARTGNVMVPKKEKVSELRPVKMISVWTPRTPRTIMVTMWTLAGLVVVVVMRLMVEGKRVEVVGLKFLIPEAYDIAIAYPLFHPPEPPSHALPSRVTHSLSLAGLAKRD